MSCDFPKISAIVPAYNVERYIEAAIDSLLEQSAPFHEIVVINDGSTDTTPSKLKKYENVSSIRIEHTVNRGLGMARNRGLERASGDYVYFFDSDDLLDSAFVQTVGAELQSDPNTDLVFFSGKNFYDTAFDPDSYPSSDSEEFSRKIRGHFESGLDANDALWEAGGFTPSACLYVSRRKLWNEKLRFQPIVHEDDELILKLCAAAGRTSVIDKVFFHRRLRKGSLMTSGMTRRHVDGYLHAFRSSCEVYRELKSRRHQGVIKKRLNILIWSYIHTCRSAGIEPALQEVLPSLLRIRHFPVREFLSVLLPANVVALLRSVKTDLRTVRGFFGRA